MTNKPIQLGNRIHLIDGFDLGMEKRTGTYVIEEENITLIETGPSPSIPYVLSGLKDLSINPDKIDYIIVTHIHLDHAGGAGVLLKECPNAKLVVHPRGARHIVDPSRLIQGAKAVYGDDFDRLFAPIIPVPEDKVIIKNDGDTLQIGPNCTLSFLDTPGHSDHHFSIYDPISNGIFTGDTIGVNYGPSLNDSNVQLYLPSTSPNQFDPDKMLQSLERIQNLQVDQIFFGHFGKSHDVHEVYKQIQYWLPLFMSLGEEAFEQHQDHIWLSGKLIHLVKSFLQQHIQDDHEVYKIIQLDMTVSAMGILHYFEKNEIS